MKGKSLKGKRCGIFRQRYVLVPLVLIAAILLTYCGGGAGGGGTTCPDPAAARIDFSIVSRTSQFAGVVRIAGVVRNVGAASYESGPTQQSVLLYEVPIGGTAALKANQAFQNLAPGEEVTVTYERNWDSSSSAEGEFPPDYRIILSYDPDIYLDGNPMNDDCNGSNNDLTRSGADINALF